MRRIWFALALLVFAPSVFAQELPRELEGREEDFSFIGNAGGEFLTIPMGARGVAMGQSFTAVVDDISALWWNPAGLGFMRSPAAFFTNVNLPLDVQYNYAGVGSPVAPYAARAGGPITCSSESSWRAARSATSTAIRRGVANTRTGPCARRSLASASGTARAISSAARSTSAAGNSSVPISRTKSA